MKLTEKLVPSSHSLLVPSTTREDPLLLVPSTAEDPPLLKTGFLQADKGAENTKEKNQALL
jgi:hypothetical protein